MSDLGKLEKDLHDEDVATMMRVLRTQLQTIMDMTDHAESCGVFDGFYNIPYASAVDAMEVFTYCYTLGARVNGKVWAEYEKTGLAQRMEVFFRRVANYKERFINAKVLENPTERLLTTTCAQDIMCNMLTLVNQQNADIEKVLDQRYNDLLQSTRGYTGRPVQQLLADLIIENKKLDDEIDLMTAAEINVPL